MFEIVPVFPRSAAIVFMCMALSGCSYEYGILAVAGGGQLTFLVDPKSYKEPSCLRQIEVIADNDARAKPEPGDDTSRVGYGTFWFESVSYDDDCANRFPLSYGATLKGQRQADTEHVKPKPLLREVVYEIATTTGATGYGGGRFLIRANGQVENLPR